MDLTNLKAEEKQYVSTAGVKFNDKIDIYEFLRRNIKQEIIITGSTALLAYGLAAVSDPLDLDLIIHKPNDETEKFISALFALFPETEHEKAYMRPDSWDFDIGKLTMLRFLGAEKDFKVHIFYKNKAQQTVLYKFRDKQYPIALPSDIFLAKRRFGRKKDYEQLADICHRILK